MNDLEAKLNEMGKEVEYTLTLKVDDEEITTISSYSQEGLQEDFRKLDYALERAIEESEKETESDIDEEKSLCPMCGGSVNTGQDNRCSECHEVIDEPVGEE